MYCPKCKVEYEEGVKVCPACDVDLVENLEGVPQKEEEGRYVIALTTQDRVFLAIVKSLLQDAQIKYFVKGEQLQDLMGVGAIGTGYNPLVGMMELYVREEDEEDVKKLLVELENETFYQEGEGFEEDEQE